MNTTSEGPTAEPHGENQFEKNPSETTSPEDAESGLTLEQLEDEIRSAEELHRSLTERLHETAQ
ncbi:hypothetical protein M3B43_11100 [Nesterenkonia massiliensis]|uniref:Nucleotide exchange factor GrpE n=1 Tax=Nesterenkonia massiliensis TaxID=1232429 RepID=A0ABT2HT37_9MICC|nr:hypothetical protein [Nesterenkonia massiliensis]MCT1607853.1 hypothetical protein [Nesterenkonia massiliensis]